MTKLVIFASLLIPIPALAQPSNPSIVSVTTAPSGACTAGLPNQQVISTGTQYSCQAGTWGAIGSGSASGTVTSVGVTTANGFSCTVANPTTTAVLTCTLGAITPSSVSVGSGAQVSIGALGTATNWNLDTTSAATALGSILTLTTTGSGAASLSGTTLNIPTPASGACGQLAQNVVGVATPTITFNSITGSCSNLKVTLAGFSTTTVNDVPILHFDGDSTTSHYWAGIIYRATAATLGTTDAGVTTGIQMGGINSSAATAGVVSCYVYAYTSTILTKQVTCNSGEPSGTQGSGGLFQNQITTGQWNTSSSAITSITITLNSGANFGVGTVATLYGEQ